MASGDTKTEAMLNVLGNGGSGDEFRGCCNTKTQSYILDAIDRINALQPGGTSDFNDLENRPQLNGTAMTGNTNITNFTGTDGTNAGAQGLVPAPAAADADKFLKSDGTWATAGGGETVRALTTDDYNWPTSNPTHVATWLLDDGFYVTSEAVGGGKVALTGNQYVNLYRLRMFYVQHNNNGNTTSCITVYITDQTSGGGTSVIFTGVPVIGRVYMSNIENPWTIEKWTAFDGEDVVNSLDAPNTGVKALHAYQGKVLKDLIDALDARVTALEGGNASQNSSSSAEPEPEPGGGSAQAPTYPYYEGTHVFYLYNGQEVYYDETSPVQDLYYRDGTLAMAEADWCQDEGQGTVYYCGGGGDMEPVEPEEPIAPEEPTEEPVEG